MPGDAEPSRWITTVGDGALRRLQLVCFPYAGSGTNVYRAWRAHLPAEVEMVLVQLPGREARLREPAHVGMDALLDDLVPALRPHLEPPFAFFGHSMGALVAYETARRLRRVDERLPARLLVSGHRAPHLPYGREPVHTQGDDVIDREFERQGATPPEILRDENFMRVLRPILRADLELCETYVHERGEPLDCSITAFGGREDGDAPPATLRSWEDHTRGAFRLHLLEGRHFFIHTQRPRFLAHLVHELRDIP